MASILQKKLAESLGPLQVRQHFALMDNRSEPCGSVNHSVGGHEGGGAKIVVCTAASRLDIKTHSWQSGSELGVRDGDNRLTIFISGNFAPRDGCFQDISIHASNVTSIELSEVPQRSVPADNLHIGI